MTFSSTEHGPTFNVRDASSSRRRNSRCCSVRPAGRFPRARASLTATRSCSLRVRGAESEGCYRAIRQTRSGGARRARFCDLADARAFARRARPCCSSQTVIPPSSAPPEGGPSRNMHAYASPSPREPRAALPCRPLCGRAKGGVPPRGHSTRLDDPCRAVAAERTPGALAGVDPRTEDFAAEILFLRGLYPTAEQASTAVERARAHVLRFFTASADE